MVYVRILLYSLAIILIAGCEFHKSEGFSVIGDHVEFGISDHEKIVSNSNALGFEIIDKVDKDDHNNVFISPASLYMLLSLVYNGANDATKAEMGELLGVKELSQDEINKANASLLHTLSKQTDKVLLEIGNSVWINNKFTLTKDFIKKSQDFFNGEVKEVPMSDPKTANEINRWVYDATNGKIEEIVEGPLDKRVITLLINAIYFNGEWQYAFEESETRQDKFHLENGLTSDIDYMKLERKLPFFETKDFQAISLPYGDGEMSMNIFLPREHVPLDAFMNQLTEANWDRWQESFTEQAGTIILPKLTLEYETNLKESLMQLGMTEAFSPVVADFSEMIAEENLVYLDEIKQKTYLDIHEKGTEAAAVTSVQIRLTSAPIEQPFYMDVNRPFFFTITDRATGTILFMGSIHLPT